MSIWTVNILPSTSTREINSPLEQFEIRDLLSLEAPILGDIRISITNIGLYLTIAGLFILLLNILSTNYNKLVSNNWSISQESLYATIHSIVTNQINGKTGQIYFPFIYALFIIILINNLVGMVIRSPRTNNLFFFHHIYNHYYNQNHGGFAAIIKGYSSIFGKNPKVRRHYSTSISKLPSYTTKGNNSYYLNPNYITGFVDAEGCFTTSIFKDSRMLLKWQVKPIFKISMHNKDINILEALQRTWGVGKIYKHSENASEYRVSSLKNLRIIIDHFDKYPLITQKFADYLLFKQSVNLIENKAHLTTEGLLKLVSLKASLNWGLSEKFKETFPNVVPTVRPTVKFTPPRLPLASTKSVQAQGVDGGRYATEILDVNWFVGFVEGEGCFMVSVQEAKCKTRYDISLRFTVTQHNRDLDLLNGLINYLGCGRCYLSRNEATFIVSKFGEISNKIIPLFNEHSLLGTKRKDYLDFLKVAELILSKDHLTKEGVEKIKLIKNNMNSNRILP